MKWPKVEVGSEKELYSRNGNIESGGFIWGKWRRRDEASSILGIVGVERCVDRFELCFMSNHLECEFQFGT
jgi:hypothetical protein